MNKLLTTEPAGRRIELRSPVAAPAASAFLWNERMLLQVNCRGFAAARYVHGEAATYSHGPTLEAKTFMQPEMPLFSHHPGRFVYVRDDRHGELYSLPYEPVRRLPDEFVFSAGRDDIEWRIRHAGIVSSWSVCVARKDVAELWTLMLRNESGEARRLHVYPHFTIGFMSWMNQSACYREDLGAIVATSVTPYQKTEDYLRIKRLKDLTVLLHDTRPDAWECSRFAFEGEGGLACPDAVTAPALAGGEACYEVPVATLQYDVEIAPGETREFRFVFAPAADEDDVATLRSSYIEQPFRFHETPLDAGCVKIRTPDSQFDDFVNVWLDRQVLYHGEASRVTADPQTRNYLQDNMGMVYVDPAVCRRAILTTLAQQHEDGALPDGIILHTEASLNYINEIPHTDHNVWLPVCLQAYLDETADHDFLEETVGETGDTVLDRVTSAMRWLIGNRDERGLSLIAEGDWCDPMNMVGHEGKGVSAWLTIATVRALNIWARTCRDAGQDEIATEMAAAAEVCGDAVNEHFWHEDRFARGISDNGTLFGVPGDEEGSIFLNPQSWALLADIVPDDDDRRPRLMDTTECYLETRFGMTLLDPPFTRMHEHIGRLTQKYPGTAENGSIYNHASAFYIHALYRAGRADKAFDLLRTMIPACNDESLRERGQLPVFVPNYYRGAVTQKPHTAGRSSQLPNTGAASWAYRIIIEQLFGLRGVRSGLRVAPLLPSAWHEARATRRFRGASFEVGYRRGSDDRQRVQVDDQEVDGRVIRDIEPGRSYRVLVTIAAAAT